MISEVYLPDANVLIRAKNDYYRFNIAPCFWQCLVEHALSGRVLLLDRIASEFEPHKDELDKWVKDNFHGSLAKTDTDNCVECYGEIARWVNSQNYKDANRRKFLDKDADPWLIAYAKVNDCTVVTNEEPVDARSKKVKIPNVCDEFNVKYVNTYDMLEKLEACWN